MSVDDDEIEEAVNALVAAKHRREKEKAKKKKKAKVGAAESGSLVPAHLIGQIV